MNTTSKKLLLKDRTLIETLFEKFSNEWRAIALPDNIRNVLITETCFNNTPLYNDSNVSVFSEHSELQGTSKEDIILIAKKVSKIFLKEAKEYILIDEQIDYLDTITLIFELDNGTIFFNVKKKFALEIEDSLLDLSTVANIRFNLDVHLGSKEIPLKDILRFSQGSIINLETKIDEMFKFYLSDTHKGFCEIGEMEQNKTNIYAIRIKEIYD